MKTRMTTNSDFDSDKSEMLKRMPVLFFLSLIRHDAPFRIRELLFFSLFLLVNYRLLCPIKLHVFPYCLYFLFHSIKIQSVQFCVPSFSLFSCRSFLIITYNNNSNEFLIKTTQTNIFFKNAELIRRNKNKTKRSGTSLDMCNISIFQSNFF